MSRRYYERDSDWLVTCSECHGEGAIGKGASRIRCSKCDGAGKVKQ